MSALERVEAAVTPSVSGVPISQIQEFVMNAMPVAAVAHSFHVDALADPRLNSDPTFQRFSMIELNELHHQVAALGNLIRLQNGDQSALSSLGYNLAAFLANRQMGLQTAQQLPAYVKNDPRMQVVTALTEQSNRQIQANYPVLLQTVQLTGAAPTAIPMLVHTP